MKLASYLEANKLKDREFADRIGIDRSSVTHIRLGRRRPSFNVITAIHDATGGQVTYQDFVTPRSEAAS
jgi:transcriptional regulator with XRE-family HTH domain